MTAIIFPRRGKYRLALSRGQRTLRPMNFSRPREGTLYFRHRGNIEVIRISIIWVVCDCYYRSNTRSNFPRCNPASSFQRNFSLIFKCSFFCPRSLNIELCTILYYGATGYPITIGLNNQRDIFQEQFWENIHERWRIRFSVRFAADSTDTTGRTGRCIGRRVLSNEHTKHISCLRSDFQ